ncbi:MAG TPA: peptide-methionine (R)-S-oxide reductase MsrB [Phycisphaerales bacterium]|nr:peptide-methionine (R)-S-oxide reductase MsrB [Phycisphaerales bacterium]
MLRTIALCALALVPFAACSERVASPAPGATRPQAVESTTPPMAKRPETNPMTQPVNKTDEQWRKELTPEQYHVLREKGTERAFTGEFWKTPQGPGEYRCAGCGGVLFRGADKFVSECGWPAFDKAIKGSIDYHSDRSFGMVRTEVTCARCGGHLGHVFDDGPTDTRTRYCINSVSITYHPDATDNADAQTEAVTEAR